MKAALILFALLAGTNAAQAAEKICGVLTSVNIPAECKPGEICPHSIRVEHVLTDGSGKQTVLETRRRRVLSKMMALDKQTVCAVGEPLQNGEFEVFSIALAKAASYSF